MSHDCCKKCGVMEPIPYQSIRTICLLADCPQKLQKERMDNLLKNIPKQDSPFSKVKND